MKNMRFLIIHRNISFIKQIYFIYRDFSRALYYIYHTFYIIRFIFCTYSILKYLPIVSSALFFNVATLKLWNRKYYLRSNCVAKV